MKEQTYVTSLKEKHSILDKTITKEMSSVRADMTKVSELKRQKLQLKEEITKLSKQ